MLYQRVVLFSLILGLGSCGYQPLYGTSTTGNQVANQLDSISIDQQNTRTGQLIRNEILTSTGHNSDRSPRYKLGFTASTKNNDTVKTFGSDVVRKSFQLSVKYTLSNASNGKVVHRGNTFSHVSYDKTAAPFADHQARINAEERAAKEVGNDISVRLAAYFASR